jgi:Phosphotransferase enzyme family
VTGPSYQLSATQRALLERWLPGARVARDHSWGQVERAVLELARGDERFIVKAGGPTDHHMAREIHAHLHWLDPWVSRDRAPALLHHDVGERMVVTTYLPGRLVLDSPDADEPGVHAQAGALLADLHSQLAVVSEDYEIGVNRKALAWLDGPHRIPPAAEQELRERIAAWPTPPATLVPTHGDWQPRNWLVHEGVVRVIDFGRALLRPATSDLVRLASQDFQRDPALETAFLAGYGPDPRHPDTWHRDLTREAIGTAAWAHQVGDDEFEAQGLRMVAAVLSAPATPRAGHAPGQG